MLESYRQQIDVIDNQILGLLAERAQIVQKIGAYKQEKRIPIHQPERRYILLQNRKEKGKELGLCSVFVENVRNLIHEESLNLQKKNG